MNDAPPDGLDEIDRNILRILAKDPRMPYGDIAEELEDAGYEMSSEGIRYRVSQLFDTVLVLLMTAPEQHGWEVLRIFVDVKNESEAKERAYEQIQALDFWLVCKNLGSFDLYAVATAQSNMEADRLVNEVRGLDPVAHVEHALETGRETEFDNYLSME